ncbi:hypothetical protein B296_00001815, partial [Ensete ventricosum]
DTSRVADCGSAPIAFGASSPAAKSIREHSCYVIVRYPLFLFYAGTTLRAHSSRRRQLDSVTCVWLLDRSNTGRSLSRSVFGSRETAIGNRGNDPTGPQKPCSRVSFLHPGPHSSHTSCLPEASSVGGSELRMPPKSPKAKKKCFPTRKPHFFKVLLGDFAQRLASPLSTFSSSSSSPSSRPY